MSKTCSSSYTWTWLKYFYNRKYLIKTHKNKIWAGFWFQVLIPSWNWHTAVNTFKALRVDNPPFLALLFWLFSSFARVLFLGEQSSSTVSRARGKSCFSAGSKRRSGRGGGSGGYEHALLCPWPKIKLSWPWGCHFDRLTARSYVCMWGRRRERWRRTSPPNKEKTETWWITNDESLISGQERTFSFHLFLFLWFLLPFFSPLYLVSF